MPFSIYIKSYVFLFLVIPVVAIFCVNINNESTLDAIGTILEFFLNQKYFVREDYIKDFKKEKYVNKEKNVK